MIAWLLSLFRPKQFDDPAWKPTGLKFRTPLHYEQDKAVAMFERSRTHTATGRKIPRPRLVKSERREIRDNVYPMVRKGGAQ